MTLTTHLTSLALSLGATRAGIIDTSKIQFSESFRQLCEMNHCGHYGKNWMCPPQLKEVETLKREVLEYLSGLVIQTVSQLEDSFDYEGMLKAADLQEEVFRRILDRLKSDLPAQKLFPLNAGQCKFCPSCPCPDEPCRYPDEAIASLEAYGIDVNALVSACGIPYNNGPATVSYAGLILLPSP